MPYTKHTHQQHRNKLSTHAPSKPHLRILILQLLQCANHPPTKFPHITIFPPCIFPRCIPGEYHSLSLVGAMISYHTTSSPLHHLTLLVVPSIILCLSCQYRYVKKERKKASKQASKQNRHKKATCIYPSITAPIFHSKHTYHHQSP